MIIVQLKHGFGNQLFQYATARRLSLKLGVPLTLDLSFYRTHRLRSYALDRLNIDAGVATAWEMFALTTIPGPRRPTTIWSARTPRMSIFGRRITTMFWPINMR